MHHPPSSGSSTRIYNRSYRSTLKVSEIILMTPGSSQKDQEGRALHKQITYELFDLLEKKSYFLKLEKCQFKQESMDLLGWTVGNREI